MNVESLMIARCVEIHDGLLYIMGGGVSKMLCQVLPININLGTAVVISADPTDAGVHYIRLEFHDPDGNITAFSNDIPLNLTDKIARLTIGNNLPVKLNVEGPHSLRVIIDGIQKQLCPLEVTFKK